MECVSAFLHFYLFENSICLCTLGNKLAFTPSVLTCHWILWNLLWLNVSDHMDRQNKKIELKAYAYPFLPFSRFIRIESSTSFVRCQEPLVYIIIIIYFCRFSFSKLKKTTTTRIPFYKLSAWRNLRGGGRISILSFGMRRFHHININYWFRWIISYTEDSFHTQPPKSY